MRLVHASMGMGTGKMGVVTLKPTGYMPRFLGEMVEGRDISSWKKLVRAGEGMRGFP